jgi:hypothetical protein
MRNLAVVGAVFLVFAGLSLAETVTGYVSDAKCHKAGAEHAACAKKCVGAGEAIVLVTEDNKVLKVHNPDALKDMVGDKVTVEGTVDNDSIHVDSAKAAE